MGYPTVDEFLQMIPENQSNKRNFENQRKLEKIYLNVPVNFGRYQVLPMNSVLTPTFPFVELSGTCEINIPRRNLRSDGTEQTYEAWIKLLPKSAYYMLDDTGRLTSSLTAADEQLLTQAYQIHSQLYNELDVRNNYKNTAITKLIRRKNYMIFHAFCVNYWQLNDQRSPKRQNFSALYVITSNKFMESLREDITNFALINSDAGDDWVNQVYNRSLSGRTGFLVFTVQNNPSGPGFAFNINHAINREEYLKDVKINEEDAAIMSDPIESFLGWQAAKDDAPVGKRKLFNASLIKEAIDFMTRQLASIRAAKMSGTDIAQAIEATNKEVLKTQVPTNTMGVTTNDPMLAQMAKEAQEKNFNSNNLVNPQQVVQNNTDPFGTPPAAHFDPVGATPQNTGNVNPAFGNNLGYSQGNNQNNPENNPQWGGGNSFGTNNQMPF